MPKPLNSLDIDTDSYIEKCFIFCLSSFMSIGILETHILFGLIRNDSIISVFAIQYRWIYTT